MRRKIAAALIPAIFAGCSGEPGAAGETAAVTRVDSAVAAPVRREPDPRKVVLFVGTSLTAGYGIGADLAYPALIQQKIDSAGLPWRVVNAGVSGETSAGGLRRADWYLQQPVDVLVLELGANDALRGLDPSDMKKNLTAIIEKTRAKNRNAAIVLAGMEAPPNLGQIYTGRFRDAFSDVAKEQEATLIPFLLEGVAGDPALNQQDGIHPTAEGQRIMARTVWKVLAPLLKKPAAP